MKFNTLLLLGLSMTVAFSSCKKDEIDDPIIPNEEEVITTLIFTLSPSGAGSDITLTFFDEDGDGPEDPSITVSDSLMADAQYTASLLLLNETESPADTINAEILDEADEHQFFFITSGLDLSVNYADTDLNGQPLGLSTILNTGGVATEGTLSVILRHEPDKLGDGVSNGEIDNAGGETDIEATFDVVIQ